MSFYFILYLFLKCLLNDYLPKDHITGPSFLLLPPSTKAQRLFLLLSNKRSTASSHLFFFLFFFFPACVCVLANSICIINSNSTCQARCSATLTLCSFSTAFPQERLYRLLVASTEMATDIPVPSYVLFIRLQICHDNSLGKSQTALTGALSLWTSRRTASCGHCTMSVQVLSITPNECALEFLSLKTTQIRMKRDSACQEFILIL